MFKIRHGPANDDIEIAIKDYNHVFTTVV